jgi:hypothetical protein
MVLGSCHGADKVRSASARPSTRDAERPESGVLNSFDLNQKTAYI